jgi:HNH endonuclease
MPCMFCGSEENLTSEHVFPAFMGGELEVPGGSCKICNGKFAVWEGKIEKATSLLLHILQIGNRYHEIPNAKFDVSVRGMDFEGLTALREPDGTFNLQDKVRETVKSDGKKHREGLFVSEKSAEKFIERARARGEKTSELAVPEELVYDASPSHLGVFHLTRSPEGRREDRFGSHRRGRRPRVFQRIRQGRPGSESSP